jgi:putative transposase
MIKAAGFAVKVSNIVDASWAHFVSILKYKAARAGKLLIEVDPRNTSKMCSCCGNIKKELLLSDRIYICEVCDFAMDRDQNAAINIKKLGMSFVSSSATLLPMMA